MTDIKTRVIPEPTDLPIGSRPAWRALVNIVNELRSSYNHSSRAIENMRSDTSTVMETVVKQAAIVAEQQAAIGAISEQYDPSIELAAPSTPVLTTSLGSVGIAWDGNLMYMPDESDEFAAPVPTPHYEFAGFRYVYAQVSPTGNPDTIDPDTGLIVSDWVNTGQVLTSAGTIRDSQPVGAQRWYRLRAFTYSGTTSEPSATANITVVGVLTPELDSAIIDAINGAQTTANTALTTANGKNKIVRDTANASSPGDYQAGDQWWKYSGSQITAMWVHDGTNWVSQTLTDSIITNLNAATISAGFLDVARLQGGSISVSKLLVTSLENLTENGSFEYETGGVARGWTLAGGSTTPATNPRTGARSLQVTSTASPFVAATSGSVFAVEAGEQYRLQGWVRMASGTSADAGVVLRMSYGPTETTLSSVSPDVSQTPAATGTSYVAMAPATGEPIWVVPVGAKFARLDIVSRSNTAGRVYNIDDVGVFKMTAGSLIVDGSVSAPKIEAGAIRGQHLAVGIGETGQRMELIGSGLSVFDSEGNKVVSIGTETDDLLSITKKNAEGDIVPVASIDSEGDGLLQNVDISGDATFQGTQLVGAFATTPVNGRDLSDIPLLEQFGGRTVAVGTTSGATYAAVAHQYASLMSAEVQLVAGRSYQWTLEGGPLIAFWASGSGTGGLNAEVWTGTSPQSVTAPNSTGGAMSTAWILQQGGAVSANTIHSSIPFGVFSVATTGTYYMLLRLVNTSTRTWTLQIPVSTGNQGRMVLRDLGPEAMWTVENWDYRATSGTAVPPAPPTKTQTWNATWSVLWGPSGSIRPSGGSLYDDGRMLQGGHTSLGTGRAGRVGFPALGLSGKTIKGAWLRVKVRHTGASTATLRLGTHGDASATTGSSPDLVNQFTKSVKSGQDLWIPIPSARWAALAAGTIRGFQIGGPNVNSGSSDYVILDGYSTTNAVTSNGVRPQLKITYQ